jgi:hypothetical protein
VQTTAFVVHDCGQGWSDVGEVTAQVTQTPRDHYSELDDTARHTSLIAAHSAKRLGKTQFCVGADLRGYPRYSFSRPRIRLSNAAPLSRLASDDVESGVGACRPVQCRRAKDLPLAKTETYDT